MGGECEVKGDGVEGKIRIGVSQGVQNERW